MDMRPMCRLQWARALGLLTVAASLTFAPGVVRADGPVTPTGKGIAGGILLGAEVVMIPIAIGGVEDAWPYPVFGALGAAGGAVGGYFVEQTGVAEPAVYMLAGGLALVIPTLVTVLNATVYGRGDDGEQPDSDETTTITTTTSARRVPLALVGIGARGARPGVPAVELHPLYSDTEIAQYGVAQGTEVRVPVLSGSF